MVATIAATYVTQLERCVLMQSSQRNISHMKKVITASDVVALVLDRKTKDFSLKFYETIFQKVSLFVSIGSLVLALFAGAFFYFSHINWLGWATLICTSVASIGAVTYQVAQIIPEILKFKNPERD
jgi:hypothetical protein